jgi:hypothetical protein
MRNEQLQAWSQLLAGTPAGRIHGPRTEKGMLVASAIEQLVSKLSKPTVG